MQRYFSQRGALRGMALAALAAILCCCWAIGYSQGVEEADSASALWIFLSINWEI
jgi:hypothetical protein